MPDARHVTFCGESFDLTDTTGAMPWMRYAKAAQAGVDTDSMEGLALIYDLLKASIVDERWARFEQLAIDNRSTNDQMWEVMVRVLEVVAERPTQRPSDSSGGPTETPDTSEADSSLRVIARLEEQGRPDLANVVWMAQESRTA